MASISIAFANGCGALRGGATASDVSPSPFAATCAGASSFFAGAATSAGAGPSTKSTAGPRGASSASDVPASRAAVQRPSIAWRTRARSRVAKISDSIIRYSSTMGAIGSRSIIRSDAPTFSASTSKPHGAPS